MKIYSYTPFKLFSAVYPEYEWLPWKFHRISTDGWESSAKQFMQLAAKELNVNSLDDWYNVSKDDLQRVEGGKRILKVYRTLYNILAAVYPEHGWFPWRFPRPSVYWADPNDWKSFMQYLANKLNINDMQDWYQVKAEV